MALQVGELFAKLRLDDSEFGRGLSGARSGLATVGTAAVAAGAAAGAAIVGLGAVGVREFAGLQRGMNEVFTLMPGISQRAMDDMTGQVRALSTEIGVVPSEVVPALYSALSAGVPPGNVFEFLEDANAAAVGGVTDLTTAVDGISGVVNAYGDRISGAAEASDLMFTAVRLGKTTFDELAGSLGNVTPIAAANHVAFEDVTAALATITSVTGDTASATTMLRQSIVELSDSGTEVGGIFQEVAGTSFREFMAEGGNLGDALGLLEQHATDSGVTIDQLFGSVEAGQAALNLTGNRAETFAANLDEMAASAGATETAYETMDQGLSRSWDRIKAAGAVLVGHLGEELAPMVDELAARFQDNLPAIQEVATRAFERIGGFITGTLIPTFQRLWAWWEDNGPTIISAVQTTVEGIQTAFAFVQGIVETVVGWFQGAFGEDSPATAELTAFGERLVEWGSLIVGIFQDAWDVIVGAVEFTVEVLTNIWSLWGDDLTRIFGSVWNGIQGLFTGALNIIQGVLNVFAGLFTGDWGRMWDGVQQIFRGVWDAIRALLSTAVGVLRGLIGAFVDLVQATWHQFTDNLRAVWQAVWDAHVQIFQTIWGVIRGAYEGVTGAMRDAWATFTGTLRDIWQGVWDAHVRIFNTVWGTIRGAFDLATGALAGAWGLFTGGLRATWDGLWNGIATGFGLVRSGLETLLGGLVGSLGAIWDGVKSVLAAPINWVAEHVINGLIGAVNQVSVALGAGQIGALAVPLVPTHHDGGIVGRDGRNTSLTDMRPGERLIKALDGEEVLPETDPRHRNRMGESDVFPPETGGPREWISGLGDIVGSAAARARELIVATVRPLIEGLVGQTDGMADRFGVPGRIVAGAGRKVIDAALDWLAGVEDELAPSLDPSGGFQALIDYLRGTGTPHRVTSTLRPGSTTRSGNVSRHALGLAADFAGPSPNRAGYGSAGLRAIFHAFEPVFEMLNEVILAGAPFNIKRGRRVSPYAVADHWDHVHAALRNGGQTTRDGRYLVGEDGPELVDLPQQSTVIPLSALGRGAVGGMAQVTIQELWDGILADVTGATQRWGADMDRLHAGITRDVTAMWDRLAADVTTRVDRLGSDVTIRVERLATDVTARVDGMAVTVAARFTDMTTVAAAMTAAIERSAAAATAAGGAFTNAAGAIESSAARVSAAAGAAHAGPPPPASSPPAPTPRPGIDEPISRPRPPRPGIDEPIGRPRPRPGIDEPIGRPRPRPGVDVPIGRRGSGSWESAFTSAVRAGVS